MSKKGKKNYNEKSRMHKNGNVIHPTFDDLDWHPLDDEIDSKRDKSYVKTIKPRSDGQRGLMEAIASHNLTLAIGPAGTGKTYLISCFANATFFISMFCCVLYLLCRSEICCASYPCALWFFGSH